MPIPSTYQPEPANYAQDLPDSPVIAGSGPGEVANLQRMTPGVPSGGPQATPGPLPGEGVATPLQPPSRSRSELVADALHMFGTQLQEMSRPDLYRGQSLALRKQLEEKDAESHLRFVTQLQVMAQDNPQAAKAILGTYLAKTPVIPTAALKGISQVTSDILKQSNRAKLAAVFDAEAAKTGDTRLSLAADAIRTGEEQLAIHLGNLLPSPANQKLAEIFGKSTLPAHQFIGQGLAAGGKLSDLTTAAKLLSEDTTLPAALIQDFLKNPKDEATRKRFIGTAAALGKDPLTMANHMLAQFPGEKPDTVSTTDARRLASLGIKKREYGQLDPTENADLTAKIRQEERQKVIDQIEATVQGQNAMFYEVLDKASILVNPNTRTRAAWKTVGEARKEQLVPLDKQDWNNFQDVVAVQSAVRALKPVVSELLAKEPGANLGRALEIAVQRNILGGNQLTAIYGVLRDPTALQLASAYNRGRPSDIDYKKVADQFPKTTDIASTGLKKLDVLDWTAENRLRILLGQSLISPTAIVEGVLTETTGTSGPTSDGGYVKWNN